MLARTPITELPVIDQLEHLRQFLTRDKWGQFHLAIDCNGDECFPESQFAERFCIEGAIVRLFGERFCGNVHTELERTAHSTFHDSCGVQLDLHEVNDFLGYDAVMSVIDKTVERLR